MGESTPFGSTYIAAHPADTRAGIGVLAPELIGCDARRVERIGDATPAGSSPGLGATIDEDVLGTPVPSWEF